MKVELKIKKIGNSLGVIIPKEVVRKLGLAPGERIVMELKRKSPKTIFGLLKGKKLDPEKAKVFKGDEKW